MNEVMYDKNGISGPGLFFPLLFPAGGSGIVWVEGGQWTQMKIEQVQVALETTRG